MEPGNHSLCSRCAAKVGQGDLFCLACGALSPVLLSPGAKSFELLEVPSERLRGELIRMLKSWFPALDGVKAEAHLKAGPTILVEGIDEESGRRLRESLKAIKVEGRTVEPPVSKGFLQRLWNPGLVISGLLLLVALLVKGLIGVGFVLLAAAVPAAWALAQATHREPLIVASDAASTLEHLAKLSAGYAEVVEKLAAEDADKLRSLTAAVFELQRRLKSNSLASFASGADTGDLYERLTDSLMTAVDLGRRLADVSEAERGELRHELDALCQTVHRTAEWFRRLEDGEVKGVPELTHEIARVTDGIDRILQDVRGPAPEGLSSRRRSRA